MDVKILIYKKLNITQSVCTVAANEAFYSEILYSVLFYWAINASREAYLGIESYFKPKASIFSITSLRRLNTFRRLPSIQRKVH